VGIDKSPGLTDGTSNRLLPSPDAYLLGLSPDTAFSRYLLCVVVLAALLSGIG